MPADHTPHSAQAPCTVPGPAPAGDVDQVPQAPSTGPSIAPSTTTSPAGRVSAGQPRKSRSRDAFDNPPSQTPKAWKPTGVRRKEVPRALGIFQRATPDQLWRTLRPADRHDRCTRDTLNALKGVVTLLGAWVSDGAFGCGSPAAGSRVSPRLAG